MCSTNRTDPHLVGSNVKPATLNHFLIFFTCTQSFPFSLLSSLILLFCRPSAGTSDLRVKNHDVRCKSTTHHLLIKQRDGGGERERGEERFFHRDFSPRKTFKCPSDLTRGESWNRPSLRNLSNRLPNERKTHKLLICIFSYCNSNSKFVPFFIFLFLSSTSKFVRCDVWSETRSDFFKEPGAAGAATGGGGGGGGSAAD